MSRPRVFISSTYYDFKTIRDDLDKFVTSMGYEPVRHEMGHISYGREDKPEFYAYREIEFCDILVSIIGGRFGSAATASEYSITQEELRRAHENGKQVYIFVDRAVHAEFDFYRANKTVTGVKFMHASDVRIYSFLEEIYALPNGNPIFSFTTATDIITILREQWSGLFQRLLVQETVKAQTTVTQELQRSLQTVDQLVKFLKEEKTKGDQAVQEIIFRDHPLFSALQTALTNKYRVYFTNFDEMGAWIENGKFYGRVDPWEEEDGYYEWMKTIKLKNGEEVRTILVSKALFDEDGALKAMSPGHWDVSFVKTDRRSKPVGFDAMDDDIPF